MKRLLRTHPDLAWALGLLALGAVIYLPRLASFPLWDPWEPHYSQVAWEMQTRDTWLNPWYRNADNWWSKPILMLWMLRASFAVLWDPAAHLAGAELAARLPFALTAIVGGVLQYDWTRRLFGRRVGVLAAVALLTAPQYLLIGRQVMADMPFVVAYAAAMGYLAVGLFTRRAVAGDGRLRGLVRTEWPFAVFWVLQAVAVLAKGFVPPVLALMVLAGYALVTFRWRDYEAPRRWGRYLAPRLPIAFALAGAGIALVLLAPEAPADLRALVAVLVAVAVGLAIWLGVFRELPPSRHALRLLARLRAAWGLPLFLAVAAPWFAYMTVEHGWPYWREFIFYHHLGRAAGTIDKPGATFDFFVRQLGFGLFPWSALLPAALWRFLGRASAVRSTADRRNLYVLLALVLPYLFFSLSGTKFAHYVFPVVPFAAVLVAAALVWLGKGGEPAVALAETQPALGPAVPAAPAEHGLWWQRPGAKGDLALVAGVTLVAFGIIAHDLVGDFRHFLRLFVYYQNRATPPDYQPYVLLQVLFFPIGLVVGLWLLGRWVRRWHTAAIAGGAVVVACYLGWVTMPAMGATFTYEPLVEAYERLARPGEAVGQYNSWQQPERSVVFLFENRAQHLRNDELAAAFLGRPGRKFVIVDRDRLPALRRVARELGQKLYVVSDAHPYARLVSNEPSPEDARKVRDHVLTGLPAGATAMDAVFDDTIRLVGFALQPEEVAPGSRLTVSFFYRAEKPVDGDWEIFVHGESPSGRGHRLRADHFPVEGLYPTNEWQEGEVIRDDFRIDVPPDYPHAAFHLWTGFYAGERRMRLTGGAPSDGEDRLRGPLVRVRRR